MNITTREEALAAITKTRGEVDYMETVMGVCKSTINGVLDQRNTLLRTMGELETFLRQEEPPEESASDEFYRKARGIIASEFLDETELTAASAERLICCLTIEQRRHMAEVEERPDVKAVLSRMPHMAPTEHVYSYMCTHRGDGVFIKLKPNQPQASQRLRPIPSHLPT